MLTTWADLAPLLQILFIDVTLAGDNAIMIGMAVQGLDSHRKKNAIAVGVTMAAVVRIALALVATKLLAITGLTLVGGLLLLWVCWKMLRELRAAPSVASAKPVEKSLASVIWTIAVADLSMSLDNVLAVAGAAIGHPYLLIFGLILSVALMGFCATLIARLLERHRWIAWLGLLVVLYVAIKLIIRGGLEVGGVFAHLRVDSLLTLGGS